MYQSYIEHMCCIIENDVIENKKHCLKSLSNKHDYSFKTQICLFENSLNFRISLFFENSLIYVGPQKGTGPVLELGPHFHPVLELGH